MKNWIVIVIVTCVAVACFKGEKIFKVKKSVKDNSLEKYLYGYLLTVPEATVDTIGIFGGVLGINETQIIFSAHRYKDNSLLTIKKIADICSYELLDYSKDDICIFTLQYTNKKDNEVVYVKQNSSGYSISKRIPNILIKQKLCKIRFSDDSFFYFYFKESPKSTNIVKSFFEHNLNRSC